MGCFKLKNIFPRTSSSETQPDSGSRVKEMLHALSLTPAGKALADMVRDREVRIHLSLDEKSASKINLNLVKVCAKASLARQVRLLAHELRHIDQQLRGYVTHNATNIYDNLVMTRFKEADAFAIEAQIAWELSEGKICNGAWREYKKQEPRLAKVYEAGILRGFDVSQRMNAIFNEWFKSRYKDMYDKGSIYISERQLERKARGKMSYPLAHYEMEEFKSLQLLASIGENAGNKSYLDSIDTDADFYTGNISFCNRLRINKLMRNYKVSDDIRLNLPKPD